MPLANATPLMPRAEIRPILDGNKGSKLRLATELGLTQSAISMWLAGKSKSARIHAAAERLAVELSQAKAGGES